MKPFTNFESRIVPLPINNVDTDQVIPARFLKTTSKLGLDKELFFDWRYDDKGQPKADFILNRPETRGAEVLLAGMTTSAAVVRASTRRGRSRNSVFEP